MEGEIGGDRKRRLVDALQAEGLGVTEWRDDPGASYAPHEHPHREVRIVLRGSMTIIIGGVPYDVRAGDRIDIPPRATHTAVVGSEGVTYLAGSER